METSTRCNLACEILRATRDGDDLSPRDLKLVELMVNGECNESGEAAFDVLHKRVMDGSYAPDWLQGVEHLTRDHAGYVYWKGQEIEHWSGNLAYSEHGKTAAEELARRCQILDDAGTEINVGSVVWNWPESDRLLPKEVTA